MGLNFEKRSTESGAKYAARWFFVGQTESGHLIGWSEEDELEFPHLKEVKKEGRVQVAPFTDPRFLKVRANIEKRLRRFKENGEFPEKIEKAIDYEAASKTVLRDWEDIELKGEPMGDYTPSKGQKMFEEAEGFEPLVVGLSMDLTEERRTGLKEDADALGNASGGKSAGTKSSRASSAKG